jgi:hypothetical protein
MSIAFNHAERAKKLGDEISRKIAELRELAVDPVDIVFSEGVSFEVRPAADDARLVVFCAGKGATSVNYGEAGLAVKVFGEDDLVPLQELVFCDAEIMAAKESPAPAGA